MLFPRPQHMSAPEFISLRNNKIIGHVSLKEMLQTGLTPGGRFLLKLFAS